MNRARGVGAVVMAVAVAGVVWMGGGGCEVVQEFNSVLTISPSSTNLTTASAAVVFSADVRGLTNSASGTSSNSTSVPPPILLPLRWSVSDVGLGAIRASGAFTAIYERNGDAVGNNYLRVEDAAGRYEGVAVVSQTTPEEEAGPATVSTNAP
jgi:hypothetical protein